MGNDKDFLKEDIVFTYIGETNQNGFLALLGGELLDSEVALGALKHGAPIGVIVFSLEGNSSELRYIFVEESCRRQGVGTRLFTEAAEVLQKVGVEEVFCYYEGQKEITSFFKKNGGLCLPSSEIYSLPVAELLSSNQVHRLSMKAKDAVVMSFDELSPGQWKNCKLLLEQHPYFDVSLLESQNYKKELSFVYMEEDKLQSIILVNATDTENQRDYYVTLALSLSEEPLPILYVLQAFYEEIKSKKQNGKLSFLAYNPQIVSHLNDWIGHPMEEKIIVWTSYFSL